MDGLAPLGVSVPCTSVLPHTVMGFLSAQPMHNLTESEIVCCGVLFLILAVRKGMHSSWVS